MNEIARRLPPIPTEPKMSGPLRLAVESAIAPSMPGLPVLVRTEAERDEARALSLVYARMSAPARPELIEAWMVHLSDGVRNPPDPEGLARRMRAVMLALSDLPVGVWSRDSLMEAIAKFDFWPSVAELDKHLRGKADKINQEKRGLGRVAEAQVFVPARGVSREQEIAYIQELAQANAEARRQEEEMRMQSPGDDNVVAFPGAGELASTGYRAVPDDVLCEGPMPLGDDARIGDLPLTSFKQATDALTAARSRFSPAPTDVQSRPAPAPEPPPDPLRAMPEEFE